MKKTAAIALGTFDGIHKGHYSVLRGALDFCADIKVVVTFAVPPMRAGAGLVMPESVKERLLTEMGFDEILLLDFPKVRDMSPEEFLQMIFERYNVVAVSCGFNHRFGKKASGDTKLLEEYCKKTNAACLVHEPVLYENEPISSSRIRAEIESGNMQKAADMLGFDYFIEAPVVSGDARGRQMDFPTANQLPSTDLALPKFGVYKTVTEIDGVNYPSITNIGIRPTYKSKHPIAETHIIGFSGDLYGKTVKVSFKKFIRDEKKFSSLDEVAEQIKKDIES